MLRVLREGGVGRRSSQCSSGLVSSFFVSLNCFVRSSFGLCGFVFHSWTLFSFLFSLPGLFNLHDTIPTPNSPTSLLYYHSLLSASFRTLSLRVASVSFYPSFARFVNASRASLLVASLDTPTLFSLLSLLLSVLTLESSLSIWDSFERRGR